MDDLLVRLQHKTFIEVRYLKGMCCMHEERLTESGKELAAVRAVGEDQETTWLVEDREALADELFRLIRCLESATRRLAMLDLARYNVDPTGQQSCLIRRTARLRLVR